MLRPTALIAVLLVLVAGVPAIAPARAQTAAPAAPFAFAPLGTYSTGLGSLSGETVALQGTRAFVTNSVNNSLDIVDFSLPAAPRRLARVDLSPYGAGPNSVAVRDRVVAVAVEASPKTDPGQVVFLDLDGRLLGAAAVGALPDMLTFTPDGKRLLVANEGEPNDLYTVDPEGTVSIITVQPFVTPGRGRSSGAPQAIKAADFRAFNAGGPRNAELSPQIRIFGPGAAVAQDLEPEYIAVSPDSRTAYVTLQENNALAVIDVNTGAVAALLPLGAKDHSRAGNGLDASDRDGRINIRSWPVFGLYMPDGIAAYEAGGERFLVTANEGDARVYPPANIPNGPAEGAIFNEEIRVGNAGYVLDPAVFPDAADLKRAPNLGRLTVSRASGDTDGDGDFERIEAFGGRSFSIWGADGALIWDSGDQLEQITAGVYPRNFNASNTNNTFDDRSDNKGPEPEGVAVGAIDGRSYAFVGLERIGGVMIYDVSDPRAPQFVQYVNNRNFALNPPGPDSGPEIVVFVPAAESPSGRPRVVTANEVSGTVTIYEAAPLP
jgi:YVTN family beta-propeller protein